MSVGIGTYVGPAPGSVLTPSNIVIYIASNDFKSGFPHAAEIGLLATVAANIYAPNGTIMLNQGASVTGAFYAKVVRAATKVSISLASGFGAPLQSKAVPMSETENAQKPETPKSYALLQNYPNPFNPTTLIRYALPQQANVTLTVYNLLGQEVARLVDEVQRAGYHEVRWDSRNIHGAFVSSGIYFYRISAGTYTDIKKMILLR